MRVLLVDDQPIVGETLRQMFANEADIEFRFCPDPVADQTATTLPAAPVY